jgi:hypothetical protein
MERCEYTVLVLPAALHENAELRRAKLLKDTLEPIVAKSRADMFLPR